jgi:2-iminobutanoate/2-iminopropanoate deaminase
MEHHTFPDTAVPKAYGAYSHAVIAGDFVFVAGQTARDSITGRVIEGDVSAQTHRCLEIVRSIMGELGLGLTDIVRSTVYLANIDDWDAMNRVYSSVLQPPYPARSTPEVKLPFGALVSIEVTAYRGRKPAATETAGAL